MSLNLLDRSRKSFNLRLTLWYAVVLLLTYALIFALAYYTLSSSLKKEDRKAIASKFDQYRVFYQEGELRILQARIASERNSEKASPFFVRVADPDKSILLLSLPNQWQGLNLARISDIKVDAGTQRIHMAVGDEETVFEIISFPLSDGNIMQIGKEIGDREHILARFRWVFAAVMIPAILIGLMGGYFLTFRALQPIRHLTKTVTSIIETGRIEARVPLGKTEDEVSGLVALFNNMLGRIENLVTGMKESLDSVAHDLRTPMARFRGQAENVLASNQGLEACREALSDGLEESERITNMLNTLMDISEAKAGTLKLDRERVDLSALAKEVVEVYCYVAEEKDVAIRTSLSGEVFISADPNRMRQVFGNLLDNAVKYTPGGGIVNVGVYKKDREVVAEVRDNGIGISEEDLPRIWDRLYRGDHSRSQRGFGLGLSMVRSIAELHGGRVEVLSRRGAGSAFFVYLPGIE
jgi:heavy metal sensor kinase